MRIFSLVFSVLVATLIGSSSMAQSNHDSGDGHDHLKCLMNTMTQAYKLEHPEAAALMEQETQELEEFTRDYVDAGSRAEVLIIPVVFHIVHANGVENITNEQVFSAMEVINEDFNMETPGVNSVVSQFQNVVGDVEFEFRLAKLDPNGNCTSGIVRTVSSQTFEGGENIKAISPTWGRASYLNIWVCNTIGNGAAGYAYLPGGAPLAGDGILIQHDYVGRIGTSNENRSHALSHEVGHWANLDHTWGQDDTPALPGNCSQDDFVSDTPNTIGWTSCNLNGSTCASLDNVQNFMDYAYCYRMFTIGQSNRMRAALNSGISSRNQLHTQANLLETGVLAPDVICAVDFNVEDSRVVCPGTPVVFQDFSFNGPTTWLWTFEGGTPATSTEASPEVTYSEPGVYDVTLFASNSSGGLTAVKSDFITVLPVADNLLPFSEGFESFTSLEPNDNNWFVVNEDGGSIRWQLSNVAYTGSKSVYVRGRNNTNGAIEFLQSPTFDLTGLSENAVLSFKYAHARRQSTTDDRLRVWISRDCGNSWTVRRTISMPNLPTVEGNVPSEFVPGGQGDWEEVIIDNIVSTFLTDEFRFRFEFESFNGNNVYIDDVNIIDGATVGLDQVDFANEIKLFPNPTDGFAQLSVDLRRSGVVDVRILDVSGRVLKQISSQQRSAGNHRFDLPLNEMSAGLYLVSIEFEGQRIVEKLILQN